MSTASLVQQQTTVPSPRRFTASSATWLAVPHPADGPVAVVISVPNISASWAPIALASTTQGPISPGVGQPALTGTIWYPAARMPRMMAGRAAAVCERLPPPSCRMTMAPGCRAGSTRRAITPAGGLR